MRRWVAGAGKAVKEPGAGPGRDSAEVQDSRAGRRGAEDSVVRSAAGLQGTVGYGADGVERSLSFGTGGVHLRVARGVPAVAKCVHRQEIV